MKKNYPGIAFRQNRSPGSNWIISIVCAAEELREWAGIPRRAEDDMTGFQRPENEDNIERIKAFFNMPMNQSPTSLLVGVHPTENPSVKLQFTADDPDSDVRTCQLEIDLDEQLGLTQIVDQIKSQIEYRLKKDIETNLHASGNEEVAPAPDEEVDEEGDDFLAKSLIDKFYKRLEDKDWCHQNEEILRDIAKPATIIDGQHRVLGASKCERNIPFAVCVLYDCTWSEQIFHFTVVNYTSRGIPDQFITANAALSLTTTELESMRTRLVQANIKVTEYELMKYIQFDTNSPFFNLINLTEKSNREKIGYKTMIRVAKAWYNARHPVLKRELLPNLYPEKGNTRAKNEVRWKAGDWGNFFQLFWNEVHKEFAETESHEPGKTLWDVGHSNLIIAAVLLQFQEGFLQDLNNQDETFFDTKNSNDSFEYLEDRIRNRAKKYISFFPARFFATNWNMKSLNTSAGKAALKDAISEMQNSKGTYQFKRSSLITGKTAT